MKEITDYFTHNDILFRTLDPIDPKQLQSRQKIDIYHGVSIHRHYYAIYCIDLKSRFITKNALQLMQLHERLIQLKEHQYKKKFLFITSPLCSKTKALLKENHWSIVIDFM